MTTVEQGKMADKVYVFLNLSIPAGVTWLIFFKCEGLEVTTAVLSSHVGTIFMPSVLPDTSLSVGVRGWATIGIEPRATAWLGRNPTTKNTLPNNTLMPKTIMEFTFQ